MEYVTITISPETGRLRVSRPLFLGGTYGVTFTGQTGGTPSVVVADCDGSPLAASTHADNATTLALDTEELLAVFQRSGIDGAPGSISAHFWVENADGQTIAQSDIPIFYSPYFTPQGGTLTRIDAKGQPGPQGAQGPKGDKGDPGMYIPVSGWLGFEVDADSNLILHAATESDIYATTNGVIDHDKKRFTLEAVGDEIHLYYHFYGDSTNFHQVVDLGNVRGAKGDQGDEGDPGQDGSTDASATLAGKTLDTSTVGSLRAAVRTIGRALGATVTAVALLLCAPAKAQDVSLEELARLVITNGVNVATNVDLSGLQPKLPYPTNAIPAAAVTNAPWLSAESDPSVGITNGTIYAHGQALTPLTEHQSLAPVVNYVDEKTTEVAQNAAIHADARAAAVARAATNYTDSAVAAMPQSLTTNDVRAIVEGERLTVPELQVGGGLYVEDDSATYYSPGGLPDFLREWEVVVRRDLAAIDIHTNLPALSASATVGDLVDRLNAVIGALHE